jgi:predicted nucleotidyltransferase
VRFDANAGWDLFDIVDMKEELQVIFAREVDIVEKGAIRNPYRRQSFMAHREVLYAA